MQKERRTWSSMGKHLGENRKDQAIKVSTEREQEVSLRENRLVYLHFPRGSWRQTEGTGKQRQGSSVLET